MILVIAEKPSVSASISKVIGAKSRKNGYFEGNGYLVSWCLGHLAEYVEPNEIDEKYVRWNYEDLPIIPEKWQLSVAEEKKEQFAILSSLLGRSDVEYVVNACDAGREGESIFRRVYVLTDCTIESEGGHDYGTDLSSQGGLPVSQPGSDGRTGDPGQVSSS